MNPSAPSLDALYGEHRSFLWGLCYRLTGSAADADDVVQDTFARALAKPPADLTRPWRPWLARVALNRARDLLRRRRQRGYVGPWLPEPIETEPASFEADLAQVSTAGRYELIESVSLAFLLAVEALTPQQRAVLLLRDVFDYTVAETATALGASHAAIKTALHRARRAMRDYDRTRVSPNPSLVATTRAVLQRAVVALAQNDHAALAELVEQEVRAYSDGGGEFFAARMPVVGRDKVVRLYTHLAGQRGPPSWMEVRTVNGKPAVLLAYDTSLPGQAQHSVLQLDVNGAGRITAIYAVLSPHKLRAVRFDPSPRV